MVAARNAVPFTEREYLALEAVAETRHEFFRGEILGMAGAEPEHNLIVQNLRLALGIALLERPCHIMGADQRVKIEATGEYFYPDVVVTCLDAVYADPRPRSLVNPQLVAEVLSPSTEGHDRGPKWLAYQSVPTLNDYLLIASDQRRVEHYQRSGEGWTLRTYSRSGRITTTAGVAIDLGALYKLVPEAGALAP